VEYLKEALLRNEAEQGKVRGEELEMNPPFWSN
jgi:hypothetical protein